MSFFDDKLSINVNERMLLKLEMSSAGEEIEENCVKRLKIDDKNIEAYFCAKEIDSSITPQSINFFNLFEINTNFSKLHPSLWGHNENYEKGSCIVKNFKIVNDIAERAVSLTEKYNNILATQENGRQYILQVARKYNKQIPDAEKQNVQNAFQSDVPPEVSLLIPM